MSASDDTEAAPILAGLATFIECWEHRTDLAVALAEAKYEMAKEIEATAHEAFIKAREKYERAQANVAECHKAWEDALRAAVATAKKDG